MKKNLLYIGIEELSEKMYPHSYDLIRHLESNFSITQYPITDRGSSLIGFSTRYSHLFEELLSSIKKPEFLYSFGKFKQWIYLLYSFIILIINYYKTLLNNKKQKKKIRNLIEKNNFDLVLVHDLFNVMLFPDKYYSIANMKKYCWSFEIISLDHDWYKKSRLVRKMVKECKKKLSDFDGIIIQDHNRAAIFDNHFNTHHLKKIYLPVSISKNKSIEYLEKRPKSPEDEIIFAQIGSIHPKRGSLKLVEEFQNCDDRIKLYLKGHIDNEILAAINAMKRKPEINNISGSFFEMRSFINKVDVGFIGLTSKNLNNHFYTRAAGQYAEYAYLAVPVIVYGMEEFGSFVEQAGCGISLNSLHAGSLQSAINKIMKNYEQYSQAAANVFEKYYNLENYIGTVINSLKN